MSVTQEKKAWFRIKNQTRLRLEPFFKGRLAPMVLSPLLLDPRIKNTGYDSFTLSFFPEIQLNTHFFATKTLVHELLLGLRILWTSGRYFIATIPFWSRFGFRSLWSFLVVLLLRFSFGFRLGCCGFTCWCCKQTLRVWSNGFHLFGLQDVIHQLIRKQMFGCCLTDGDFNGIGSLKTTLESYMFIFPYIYIYIFIYL